MQQGGGNKGQQMIQMEWDKEENMQSSIGSNAKFVKAKHSLNIMVAPPPPPPLEQPRKSNPVVVGVKSLSGAPSSFILTPKPEMDRLPPPPPLLSAQSSSGTQSDQCNVSTPQVQTNYQCNQSGFQSNLSSAPSPPAVQVGLNSIKPGMILDTNSRNHRGSTTSGSSIWEVSSPKPFYSNLTSDGFNIPSNGSGLHNFDPNSTSNVVSQASSKNLKSASSVLKTRQPAASFSQPLAPPTNRSATYQSSVSNLGTVPESPTMSTPIHLNMNNAQPISNFPAPALLVSEQSPRSFIHDDGKTSKNMRSHDGFRQSSNALTSSLSRISLPTSPDKAYDPSVSKPLTFGSNKFTDRSAFDTHEKRDYAHSRKNSLTETSYEHGIEAKHSLDISSADKMAEQLNKSSMQELLNAVAPSNGAFQITKAAVEFLSTERTYVSGLRTINKMQLRLKALISAGRPVMGISDISAIFGNVTDLLSLHEHFLKELEKGLVQGSLIKAISTVLQLCIRDFECYNTYSAGYDAGVKLLSDMRNSQPAVSNFFEIEETVELISVESFLITPIQRVPRYMLLTEQLMKESDQGEPHEDLKRIWDQIRGVAQKMNTAISASEAKRKVLQIQNVLFNRSVDLITSLRFCVRSGDLKKLYSNSTFHLGAHKKYLFILFNDIILYATRPSSTGPAVCKHVLSLLNMKFENIIDGTLHVNHAWQLSSGEKIVVMYAPDEVCVFLVRVAM